MRQIFRNVVLCDDIRDEVGNKKSLMGVLSGDILLGELPAAVQVALYLEISNPDKEMQITLTLYVDKEEIAKAGMLLPASEDTALFVLPKGIIRFEKECAFRVTAKIQDQEIELINKKVLKPSGLIA